MSAFKEAIQADRAVFINLDEFADLHNIDGREIPAVVDSNELRARQDARSKKMDGIYLGEVLIYVRPEDYGNRPAPGKPLVLDGRRYRVSECMDEDGLYAISLEAVRA